MSRLERVDRMLLTLLCVYYKLSFVPGTFEINIA